MEVPRLGFELELQPSACTTDSSHIWNLHHSSWRCQILNPLSKARDQTGIPMDSSQVLNPLSYNRTIYILFLILFPIRGHNFFFKVYREMNSSVTPNLPDLWTPCHFLRVKGNMIWPCLTGSEQGELVAGGEGWRQLGLSRQCKSWSWWWKGRKTGREGKEGWEDFEGSKEGRPRGSAWLITSRNQREVNSVSKSKPHNTYVEVSRTLMRTLSGGDQLQCTWVFNKSL